MEKQSYKIVIKPKARQNVFDHYQRYFENYSERYAETFLAEFISQVEQILPFVWGNPECRFLPTKNHIYRNIVWGNYLIIYKILKKEIWVVGLFHTKQNPGKLKSYKKVR
jgi:hypothetical protein